MSFLKRLWGYLSTLFKGGAEKLMKPEVEIEQAINEAQKPR
jgi:phage shock protein A